MDETKLWFCISGLVIVGFLILVISGMYFSSRPQQYEYELCKFGMEHNQAVPSTCYDFIKGSN